MQRVVPGVQPASALAASDLGASNFGASALSAPASPIITAVPSVLPSDLDVPSSVSSFVHADAEMAIHTNASTDPSCRAAPLKSTRNPSLTCMPPHSDNGPGPTPGQG